MKRFIPNLFLLGFVISTGLVEASDLRVIEEEAARRHLNNFIDVLKNARNVVIRANMMMPNDHEAEQIGYCGALLTTAKTKGGAGIVVPGPTMSTGRHGNKVILDYIKTRTASPTSCPVDLSKVPERRQKIETKVRVAERKIPPTLVEDPQYQRLYSVYDLKGANPAIVVLNKLFYDQNYEYLMRAQWILIRQNGCYGIGGRCEYQQTSPTGIRTDNRETGVLEFDNQIFFYNIDTTADMPELPLYGGHDRSRKWYMRLYAPQKSMEEIFSKEADAMIKRGHAPPIIEWDFYCEISFD